MKRLAILLLMIAVSGANAADYAVYSINPSNAFNGTYINDTGASGGDFKLTSAIADHIVSGQFDADPYFEIAYSVAGSGIWIQNCDPNDLVGGVRDTSGWRITTDDASPDLAAADLDGDGLDEVVFSIPSGGFLGTYANSRTSGVNTLIHEVPADLMAAGQFDGDESDEIVMSFAGSGIFIHDGFGTNGNTLIQPTEATSLAVGNVDGLSIDEVIYSLGDGSTNWHGVYVDPAAVGNAGIHYKIQDLVADGLASGDVDDDGMEEIVFGLLDSVGPWESTYVNENGLGTNTDIQNSAANLIVTGQFDADAPEEIVFNIPGFGVYINQNAFGSDVRIQITPAVALTVIPSYALPDIVITLNQLSGTNGLALTWDTDPLGDYTLLSKSNLTEPSWATNMTGIPGGTTGGVTVTTAVDQVQSFYRVTGD